MLENCFLIRLLVLVLEKRRFDCNELHLLFYFLFSFEGTQMIEAAAVAFTMQHVTHCKRPFTHNVPS